MDKRDFQGLVGNTYSGKGPRNIAIYLLQYSGVLILFDKITNPLNVSVIIKSTKIFRVIKIQLKYTRCSKYLKNRSDRTIRRLLSKFEMHTYMYVYICRARGIRFRLQFSAVANNRHFQLLFGHQELFALESN